MLNFLNFHRDFLIAIRFGFPGFVGMNKFRIPRLNMAAWISLAFSGKKKKLILLKIYIFFFFFFLNWKIEGGDNSGTSTQSKEWAIVEANERARERIVWVHESVGMMFWLARLWTRQSKGGVPVLWHGGIVEGWRWLVSFLRDWLTGFTHQGIYTVGSKLRHAG